MKRALFALPTFLVLTFGAPANAADGPCRGQAPEGWNVAIVDDDEPGTAMVIEGRVFDAESGEPLANVNVYVYQTDAQGYYSANRGMNNRDPRLCGVLRTDESGRYRVETIRPADYATGGVRAHVHFVTYGEGFDEQAHLLQFAAGLGKWPEHGVAHSGKTRETARVQTVYEDSDGTQHVIRDLSVRK